MSLGVAIKEARLHRNCTQDAVGAMGFCSGKMISAIERGERQVKFDVLERITGKLDDPRLYIEASSEITGGVFSATWLDGEAADLHRASVKDKVLEELEEAISSIGTIKTYRKPETCSQEDVQAVYQSIQQAIDAFDASAIYIAVICNEYGLDIKDMFKEHKIKLLEKKYIKKEPSGKGL